MLHSLRGRLMLLMLVAALPALAILLYATVWLREHSIVQSEASMLDQARILAAENQEHAEAAWRILAGLAEIPDLLRNRSRGCETILRDIQLQAPSYVANLAAIGPDGRLLCSALGSAAISVADRPYFRRALETSGLAGGDYIVSQYSGEPLFVFTHTIRRGGAASLILAANLELTWLQRHLRFTTLPPGAAYTVLDNNGTQLMRHPERTDEVGRNLSGTPFWHALAGLDGPGTFRSRDEDGIERLYAYAPLGPMKTPYARLVVSIPVRAAFADADRLLQLGLIALASAGILGLLVGWFGGWALVLRPMRPIFQTVRRVAAGDLDARTGVLPGPVDEVHRLAAEVDRMAAALAAENREHREATQAMQHERDRAQAYLDIVGVMVVALDAHGAITLTNRKTCEVLGCRTDACCVGTNWFDTFVPPERRADIRAVFERLMAGETAAVEYFENEVITHGGERRLVAWHNAVLRDDGGRIAGTLSAGTDITESRRLSEERERLRQQLQQAQKMEALGQLTGGIAHDFNNILSSILGFSKLALQRHVPDPAGPLAECLREVVAAGERARDLVSKMLAFSRTRPGSQAGAQAPRPPLEEALHLLVSTIPASIRIESQFEADLPHVGIAAVDLHQILMNLVINARDAMQGKGRISIQLGRSSVGESVCAACQTRFAGDYVALAVSDTGPGIPAELQQRIFEPFFTTKDIGKGSGMGLAMVHSLVCQAGGHLLLESEMGIGTTFRVLLPVAAAAGAPSEPAMPAKANLRRARRGQVLVVDDEAAICRLLCSTLQAEGWSVQSHTDPRQALERFRQAPAVWDAVISDEAMPNLSGIELMSAMQDIRPDLPFVLCTGHSDQLDEAGAMLLGARRFFRKPVDGEALLAALAEFEKAEA